MSKVLAIGYAVPVKRWARDNNVPLPDLKMVYSLRDILGYSRDMHVYLIGNYWELTGVYDLIDDIEAHGYKTEVKP